MGIRDSLASEGPGRWSARIAPGGSLCLKSHLCWLVLGSYLVSPSPSPMSPSLSRHIFSFSFLLIAIWNYSYPPCFLVRCLPEPLEGQRSRRQGRLSRNSESDQIPRSASSSAQEVLPQASLPGLLPTTAFTQFTWTGRDLRNALHNVTLVSSWT